MAIATLMRPGYDGRVVICVHVFPSSVDLYNFAGSVAPPRPPPVPNPRPPVPCVAAKITFGMSKAYSKSRVPFTPWGFSTFSQVLPPSLDRYTPPAPESAVVDARTRLGSRGSITSLLIFVVSPRPMFFHVLPASVDLYMPVPSEPRMESPVPT